MADRSLVDIPLANSIKHPAVVAWSRMMGSGSLPNRITRLNEGHSMVYRLAGIAPDGGSIIAKKCSREDAHRTRAICTRVLPLLSQPALLFYGYLEAGKRKAWLFLEDGGSVKCSLDNPDHQRAFSCWLAALHAGTAGYADDFTLPETGLDTYLKQLRTGRRKILKGLGLLELESQDDATLRTVVEWCDRIESLWPKLKAVVEGAPRTLVHGDYAPKNVLVRQTLGRPEVFPIDWETAGWGTPAMDLGEYPDLAIYTAHARACGAKWHIETVRGWAAVGKILRHIAAFDWASATLIGGWPPRGVRRMRVRLDDAMRAAVVEF